MPQMRRGVDVEDRSRDEEGLGRSGSGQEAGMTGWLEPRDRLPQGHGEVGEEEHGLHGEIANFSTADLFTSNVTQVRGDKNQQVNFCLVLKF